MTNLNIPNFTSSSATVNKPQFNLILLVSLLLLGLGAGLFLGKVSSPITSKNPNINRANTDLTNSNVEEISNTTQIETGKTYGTSKSTSKDKAQGLVKSGNINGIGTHILERPGGQTQWASLTSSALDLELFVGHQVEVTGQTNSSAKTGWLLDVDQIKVLQ